MPRRLLGLLFLLLSVQAFAVAPQWRYRVLVSAHFEVIYREEQKALAKQYLFAAERVYNVLLPIFKEAPPSIPILLQDDTDASNAMAEYLPYAHITVYPVLPSTLDSTDDYGDWAYELILHEYTHILNMFPAHGFYVPFKYIFGGIVLPNAVLPTWYLEGLAVNTESYYSDHGRLRASETLASARALVDGDKFKKESLARVNELGLSTWPYGSRPYLYGGWWWQNVQSRWDAQAITDWNDDFSRRLPFLLNGPMRSLTGQSATELFNASLERQTERAEMDLKTIRDARAQDPNTEPARDLTSERGELMVFALSPDGQRLVYWAGNSLNDPGTRVMLKERSSPAEDFAKIAPKQLFRGAGATQVRWIDPDHFIFDGLDLRVPYVSYRDLYRYDLNTKKVERLTWAARAQEPAVAPNHSDIAFIQNDGGRNHLALLNLTSGEIRQLVSGGLTQRLSSPEFLNEKQILFIVRQKSGVENLGVYDLNTHRTSTWNFQLKAAQNLRRINGGFLVTDASQNVRNVYWLRGAKVEAVSNTLTDIVSADYDPQGKQLIFSELTGDGHRLRAQPFARRTPAYIPPADLPPPPRTNETPSVAFREKSYQPFEYLRPRYWIPFVYQAESGLVFQGISENHDPVGRNSYSLLGSYDTTTKRVSYGGSFTNTSLPTSIGAGYSKAAVYLGASNEIRDTQSASLDFGNFWPFNDNLTRWTLDGVWMETAASTATYRRLGPSISFLHAGLEDPLHHWYASDVQITHAEYLPHTGYINYGRSAAQLTQSAQLGGGHRLTVVTRAVLEPKLPLRRVLILGEPNVGANYAVNLTNSNLLLRGYPSGEFLGKKVLNANVEYALPIRPLEKGYGTFPLFLQNLEAVLFADAISVDGAAYDTQFQAYVVRNLSQFYLGTGAELRLSTDAAYHLPVNFTLGLYYGANSRYGGGFTPFFGVNMGTLSGLRAF